MHGHTPPPSFWLSTPTALAVNLSTPSGDELSFITDNQAALLAQSHGQTATVILAELDLPADGTHRATWGRF